MLCCYGKKYHRDEKKVGVLSTAARLSQCDARGLSSKLPKAGEINSLTSVVPRMTVGDANVPVTFLPVKTRARLLRG